MISRSINRRDFLKFFTYSTVGASIIPFPMDSTSPIYGLGRVAVRSITIFQEPSFRARKLGSHFRDDLITLIDEILSDEGPTYNPIWYRTPHGYTHSGNLQIVSWHPQPPITFIPEDGALFEVSVPYTRTYRKPDSESDPLYRLYYKSTAWVKSVVNGADGRLWYGLLDDIFRIQYFGRAEHFRRITDDEISPISPEVPWSEKQIEIDLNAQELRAYEFNQIVYKAKISSGIPDVTPRYNGIPTITPSGRFNIARKMPLRHMGDGNLTPDLEAYELPGVPWVCFFHITGVAIHGTYWHTDFGRPRSHGCVNTRPEDAQWIYRWSFPIAPANEMMTIGYGTPVIVR